MWEMASSTVGHCYLGLSPPVRSRTTTNKTDKNTLPIWAMVLYEYRADLA